jgi:hypothetical protein
MLDIKIRNATPKEIRDLLQTTDSKVNAIKNIAWAADVLVIDQFTLAGNNDQLCDTLLTLFNVVGDIATKMTSDLQEGI